MDDADQARLGILKRRRPGHGTPDEWNFLLSQLAALREELKEARAKNRQLRGHRGRARDRVLVRDLKTRNARLVGALIMTRRLIDLHFPGWLKNTFTMINEVLAGEKEEG